MCYMLFFEAVIKEKCNVTEELPGSMITIQVDELIDEEAYRVWVNNLKR